WSRVSRHGVFPFSWSHDCIGPLTRTVEDAGQVLSVIAGRDPQDPTTSHEPVPDYAKHLANASLSGVKVGVVKEMMSEDITSREALAAVGTALGILVDKGA